MSKRKSRWAREGLRVERRVHMRACVCTFARLSVRGSGISAYKMSKLC